VRGRELTLDGHAVDIVYRGMQLRELLTVEAEAGGWLPALREAVAKNQLLSPLHGDLDHKSLLELWSSPRVARLFSAAERAVFRRHVPWTRLVTDRVTESPDAARVALPAYVRRNRARLVLKPNRACGGEGILVGKRTPAAGWERTIARALSGRAPATVQAFVRGATLDSPVVRGRRVVPERHFTNFGLMASPARLGVLGRASPMPVVNVSRRGGIMGVLVL